MFIDTALASLTEKMRLFDFKIALLIVLAYVILDVLYAFYTLSLVEKKPLRAANTSVLLYVLGSIGVLGYVDNYLYIIPLAVGAWLGTYIVIKREGNKKLPWFKIKK